MSEVTTNYYDDPIYEEPVEPDYAEKVNTNTEGRQTDPAIANLNNGGKVIVWQTESEEGQGVNAQLYDSEGNPVGSELLVGPGTSWHESTEVTTLANGNFVVTWVVMAEDYTYTYVSQTFTEDGTAIGKNQFIDDALTLTYETSTAREFFSSDIEALPDGGYVVSWQNYNTLKTKIYNADGSIRAELADQNTSLVSGVEVTLLSNDNFLVTWTSYEGFENQGDIVGSIYGADGTVIQSKFPLNIDTNSWQSNASVTALENGGFAVIWQQSSYSYDFYYESTEAIKAQYFDENGNATSGEITLAEHHKGSSLINDTETHINALPDGTLIAIWQEEGHHYRAQRLDANGNFIGEKFSPLLNNVLEETESSLIAHYLENLIDLDIVVNDDSSVTFTWASMIHDGIGSNWDNLEVFTHTLAPLGNTAATIGGDDALTISPDTTDANGDGIMEPSGTLTISDPDAGEAGFVAGPIYGEYGKFFIQESGFYSYAADANQPAILALSSSEFVVETITVTSLDGTTHDVVITIYGTDEIVGGPNATIGGDDALTISPDTTDANGDGIMEPSGTLTISDPDAGEAGFVSGPIYGEYGKFFIQESGFYSYAADANQPAILALSSSEYVTEIITVTSLDGTTHDVVITIYGTDEIVGGPNAIIGGDDALTISPDTTDANGDGIMEPSGTLTISDPDAGEAGFVSGLQFGDYGHFFIQEGGFYSYAADANQPAILALSSTEYVTETFTVTSLDGTTHDVVFTIYGSDKTTVSTASENTLSEMDLLMIEEDTTTSETVDLVITDMTGDMAEFDMTGVSVYDELAT